MKEKRRIVWIDIAKAIGIFTIYLGHFGESAGLAYEFVFKFHVPLFFFLSGCTENFNRESKIFKYIKKSINSLLIPSFFYAFLSLIIYTISNNLDLSAIKPMIFIIIKGLIRNSFFAASLWFLTCLFVIKVIFGVIRKLKYKSLILVAGFSMWLIAEYVISPRPIRDPHWIYNIDSALYYINFYIVGFLVFPYIEKLLMQDSLVKKIIIRAMAIITFAYSTLLFFNKDVLCLLLNNDSCTILLRAYLVIIFVILLSYSCKNISIFETIGKNTLYLCGNEYIVKTLIPTCFGLFGINIYVNNPLATYIYTIFLLVVANYILVPLEQPLLNRVKQKINNILVR